MVTAEDREAVERQERWLSKTTRVSTEDFCSTVGNRKLEYPGSVHKGPSKQTNFEREVTKEKWVHKETFYNSVPSNRIVSSAGSMGASSELSAAAHPNIPLPCSALACSALLRSPPRLPALPLPLPLHSPPSVLLAPRRYDRPASYEKWAPPGERVSRE